MSKHSPGKWIAHKEENSFHVCFDHGAGLCEVALVDPVSTVEGVVLVSDEQAAANAALIAAAPEMLEALKYVVFNADLAAAGFTGDQIKMIQAAIAKAEGEK